MSAEQMDLLEYRAPEREQADAEVLAGYLYIAGDWRTRREITAALSWPDWRIRHASEAADGDIIFGQRGLKHIRNATMEEYSAYEGAMKSQVEAMQARIIKSQRKFHSCGRGAA